VIIMTRSEIEPHRQRLLTLVQRLGGDVSHLESAVTHGLGAETGGGLSGVPTHLEDVGEATRYEELELALLANEEHLLAECRAALARIDAGTFGRCEDCRREIARGRLRHSPHVRYCIDCARRREGPPADRKPCEND
jgi:RNA polymerase-binding transcription factor DksA